LQGKWSLVPEILFVTASSYQLVKQDGRNWRAIQDQLVRYFLFKRYLFDFTSNDMRLERLAIIDDFELRKDGFGGLIDMPEALLIFLKNSIQPD
jgi:hypothetical protein